MAKWLFTCMICIVMWACTEEIKVARKFNQTPEIFPDYIGVVIPPNIAPLNFKLKGEIGKCRVSFVFESYQFEVKGKEGCCVIPESKWKKLLEKAAGQSFQVKVVVEMNHEWIEYEPFSIRVVSEKVDSYLAYRLIAPGYELWDEMGIYQRDLECFAQSAIIENKMVGSNCMNCHSFCMQNPEQMLFHMREGFACTILVDGDKIQKLNTKTKETISPLVYPSWHPSGDYVAFSVNTTKQAFHLHDKNRIEVYDEASDVVVYDIRKGEVITSSLLFSKEVFETFPTFSPDGKTLYFCSADARRMPQAYSDVRYNLCSISFDPESRVFGNRVDTLYNAGEQGMSVSFPRVSPDGRYLLYTLSGYGNFSIWHKDADLYMIDLHTGDNRPLVEVNSDDVESYHSWSSNSRWFVFSSRRMDGLYTSPYIAYISEEGEVGKPFLLPQEDPCFYHSFMKSFNIPEFVTGKVDIQARKLAMKAKKEQGTDVRFVFP
ncbi:MAG: PD40 domain-containing protein [Parabacteroides sp.]|nr:PD40 domain-containing protein [Parabacteroides sp.]